MPTPDDRKRRRARKWKFFWISFVLIFVGLVAFLQTGTGAKVAVFRDYCQMLRKGYLLSGVKQEADARGLLFEADPDPSGFTEDTQYVVRPFATWPMRYGCRVWSQRGVVTRLAR